MMLNLETYGTLQIVAPFPRFPISIPSGPKPSPASSCVLPWRDSTSSETVSVAMTNKYLGDFKTNWNSNPFSILLVNFWFSRFQDLNSSNFSISESIWIFSITGSFLKLKHGRWFPWTMLWLCYIPMVGPANSATCRHAEHSVRWVPQLGLSVDSLVVMAQTQ